MEIWLVILQHADYTTLKKFERVSKTFKNALTIQSFDSALFRASYPQSISAKPTPCKIAVHPVLRSLGNHIEMWYYMMATTDDTMFAPANDAALIASSQAFNSEPGSRRVSRPLGPVTATESALWPPISRECGCQLWTSFKSTMIFWETIEAGQSDYITVADVVRSITKKRARLKTLKNLGVDETCERSGKLEGLSYAWSTLDDPCIWLIAEWTVVKGQRGSGRQADSEAP